MNKFEMKREINSVSIFVVFVFLTRQCWKAFTFGRSSFVANIFNEMFLYSDLNKIVNSARGDFLRST